MPGLVEDNDPEPRNMEPRDRYRAIFVNVLSTVEKHADELGYRKPDVLKDAVAVGENARVDDGFRCNDYSDKSLKAAKLLVSNKELAETAMRDYVVSEFGIPVGVGELVRDEKKDLHNMVVHELLMAASRWRHEAGLPPLGVPEKTQVPGKLELRLEN